MTSGVGARFSKSRGLSASVSFLSSPLPPRLLAPFFARSLLGNSTETLATQANPSILSRTNPSPLLFDTGQNHSHVNQVYNTHSLHFIVANIRFPTVGVRLCVHWYVFFCNAMVTSAGHQTCIPTSFTCPEVDNINTTQEITITYSYQPFRVKNIVRPFDVIGCYRITFKRAQIYFCTFDRINVAKITIFTLSSHLNIIDLSVSWQQKVERVAII